MNSFFRNVKTLKIPAIKHISNKVTPSLSSIESIRTGTPLIETNLRSKRSRSLPPILSPFKPFEPISPLNFNPQGANDKLRTDKAAHGLNKPTLKILCKFRRNFSQRTSGKSKSKIICPREKKKNRGSKDRVFETPCIKPENDTVRRKTKMFVDQLPGQTAKLVSGNRSFHVLRTTSTPNVSFRNFYAKNSMSTAKNVTEHRPTKVKAIINLNEEVKASKFKNNIIATKKKDKVRFHYLIPEQECRQCASRNQKRLSEFFQKNSSKMGKISSDRRRYYSSYYAAPRQEQDGTLQEVEKEVVYVKDQSLNSKCHEKSVTLFNLIKWQSTRKDHFIPTNKYKFEEKKLPDQYKFPEETADKTIDPYPLEMFNDDYMNSSLESAKDMTPRQIKSQPRILRKREESPFVEYLDVLDKEYSLRRCPCHTDREEPPPKTKEPKTDSDKKQKPQKPDRRTPRRKGAENNNRHPGLILKELRSYDKLSDLEYELLKTPDYDNRKDKCKIRVPKKKDDNDRCRKPTLKDPCIKRNPCNQNYKGLNDYNSPYWGLETRNLQGPQEIPVAENSNKNKELEEHIQKELYPFTKPVGNMVYQMKKLPSVEKGSTIEFELKKCPDCGTGQRQDRCKIPVPRKDRSDDPCKQPPKKRDPCQNRDPCKHTKGLNYTSSDNNLLHRIRTLQEKYHKSLDFEYQLRKTLGSSKTELVKEQQNSESSKKEKEPGQKKKPFKLHSTNLVPMRRNSWQQVNGTPKKVYMDESHNKTNQAINARMLNASQYLDVYKTKTQKSEDKLQKVEHLEEELEETQEDEPEKSIFFHPKDNLNQKITDAINTVPKVEIGEESKLMLADAIKKMIQPVIEKEFLKYDAVKIALERMERNLERTLSSLKVAGSTTTVEPSKRFRAFVKYPWQIKKERQIGEVNEHPEVKEPGERKLEHRDPLGKISINAPPNKRQEIFEDPRAENLNVAYGKSKEGYDPCSKTLKKKDYLRRKRGPGGGGSSKGQMETSSKNNDSCKKEDPCEKADKIFKQSKKTDFFASPSRKSNDSCQEKEETICKKENSGKKQDPCDREDPCKADPCKMKDPCEKEDPCKKKEDPCKKNEDPCKKKEDPCKKNEDPFKKNEDLCKKNEDPCKKKVDPCKKNEDPCKKKEDPCKKKADPCKKEEDPCKKEDPSKKSCSSARLPETICKVDPCNNPLSVQKEEPCGPQGKPSPPVTAGQCDDKALRGGIITCKESSVVAQESSCRPPVTCETPNDFKQKELCPDKHAGKPKIKVATPVSKGKGYEICQKIPQPESCPLKPECTTKCPEAKAVECHQTACKVCLDKPEQPVAPPNACMAKKTAPESCVTLKTEHGQHGIPGMKEPTKCDVTKNNPCPCCEDKPRLESFIQIPKTTDQTALSKETCDPKAETQIPIICKKDIKKMVCEKDTRYCNTDALKRDEEEKMKLVKMEEARRREIELTSRKPVNFGPPVKVLPVKIENNKMGDSKTLKKDCRSSTPSTSASKHQEAKKAQSETALMTSNKMDRERDKSFVTSCSEKISDLCMLIVRKHKGGKKAAPIVVTLSRSQPCMTSLAGTQGAKMTCSGCASGGGSSGKGRGTKMDCSPFEIFRRGSKNEKNEKFLDVQANKPRSKSTCNDRKKGKESTSQQKSDPCISSKNEDPYNCVKKKSQKAVEKDDPCKNDGQSKKKEDPCKKKEDPCKKKEDPCKKKEDPCKKKEDPCKKKEDPCKKNEDPCKKKEDPCKKKEDPCKKMEDTSKKQEDPCKKKEKSKDDCKKSSSKMSKELEDLYNCVKKRSKNEINKVDSKKEDPCKKKEDPCKKNASKKKEDPCKKKEKKEDPCKKKKDSLKKKEDPCKINNSKSGEQKSEPCVPCKNEDYTKKGSTQDPCKKKKEPAKTRDPCKKSTSKTSKDTDDPYSCVKKKSQKLVKKDDPCKTKKESPKKKEDPCKKKEDPCKKKEDPCKKKEKPVEKKDDCKKSDSKMSKELEELSKCVNKKITKEIKKDESKEDPCKKKPGSFKDCKAQLLSKKSKSGLDDKCKNALNKPIKKKVSKYAAKKSFRDKFPWTGPCKNKKKDKECLVTKVSKEDCQTKKAESEACLSAQKNKSHCDKAQSDPCLSLKQDKDDPCRKRDQMLKKLNKDSNRSGVSLCKMENSCKKNEDQKKEDPCKKKDDHCNKTKKIDLNFKRLAMSDTSLPKDKHKEDLRACKTLENVSAKKEDPCKRKQDPCKPTKSKSLCEKSDPCKKPKQIKADPCKTTKSKESLCEKSDPCKKPKQIKADPCKTTKSKESLCDKSNPCKKPNQIKADPCKTTKSKESLCEKSNPCEKPKQIKADPCKTTKSKESLCEKSDPCKKPKQIKADPCKTTKSKEKSDPCEKPKQIKADPCKTTKSKESLCEKSDPCKKPKQIKADPCKTTKSKESLCEKSDPCIKPKEQKDPCKMKELSRKNSCGKLLKTPSIKKKDDACKKKEDPCEKTKSSFSKTKICEGSPNNSTKSCASLSSDQPQKLLSPQDDAVNKLDQVRRTSSPQSSPTKTSVIHVCVPAYEKKLNLLLNNHIKIPLKLFHSDVTLCKKKEDPCKKKKIQGKKKEGPDKKTGPCKKSASDIFPKTHTVDFTVDIKEYCKLKLLKVPKKSDDCDSKKLVQSILQGCAGSQEVAEAKESQSKTTTQCLEDSERAKSTSDSCTNKSKIKEVKKDHSKATIECLKYSGPAKSVSNNCVEKNRPTESEKNEPCKANSKEDSVIDYGRLREPICTKQCEEMCRAIAESISKRYGITPEGVKSDYKMDPYNCVDRERNTDVKPKKLTCAKLLKHESSTAVSDICKKDVKENKTALDCPDQNSKEVLAVEGRRRELSCLEQCEEIIRAMNSNLNKKSLEISEKEQLDDKKVKVYCKPKIIRDSKLMKNETSSNLSKKDGVKEGGEQIPAVECRNICKSSKEDIDVSSKEVSKPKVPAVNKLLTNECKSALDLKEVKPVTKECNVQEKKSKVLEKESKDHCKPKEKDTAKDLKCGKLLKVYSKVSKASVEGTSEKGRKLCEDIRQNKVKKKKDPCAGSSKLKKGTMMQGQRVDPICLKQCEKMVKIINETLAKKLSPTCKKEQSEKVKEPYKLKIRKDSRLLKSKSCSNLSKEGGVKNENGQIPAVECRKTCESGSKRDVKASSKPKVHKNPTIAKFLENKCKSSSELHKKDVRSVGQECIVKEKKMSSLMKPTEDPCQHKDKDVGEKQKREKVLKKTCQEAICEKGKKLGEDIRENQAKKKIDDPCRKKDDPCEKKKEKIIHEDGGSKMGDNKDKKLTSKKSASSLIDTKDKESDGKESSKSIVKCYLQNKCKNEKVKLTKDSKNDETCEDLKSKVIAKNHCKKEKEDPCKKKEKPVTTEDDCKTSDSKMSKELEDLYRCLKKMSEKAKNDSMAEDPCKKKKDSCNEKEYLHKEKSDPCRRKEKLVTTKEDCKDSNSETSKGLQDNYNCVEKKKGPEKDNSKEEDPCKKKKDLCNKKVDLHKEKDDPCKKTEQLVTEKKDCKNSISIYISKKKDPCTRKKYSGDKKEELTKEKEVPCEKTESHEKDTCETVQVKPNEDVSAISIYISKKKDPCTRKKYSGDKKEELTKEKEVPCEKTESHEKDTCETVQVKPNEDVGAKKEDPCKKIDSSRVQEDPCQKRRLPTKATAASSILEHPCKPKAIKQDECEKMKKIFAKPRSKNICDAYKSQREEETKTVVAKECASEKMQDSKNDFGKDPCKEKDGNASKEQCIQKGLKDLTALAPGCEQIQDMGLLGQCMKMVKNKKTPVITTVSDEEAEKAMSRGKTLVCKVKKLGCGEKMICSEEVSDDESTDCPQEPNFEEEGVERVLKCAIVRDKNNREKFVCTEILPKSQVKDNEDLQSMNEKCEPQCVKSTKIKVISNKLVCRKCPALTSDKSRDLENKDEIYCELATVEEIKTVKQPPKKEHKHEKKNQLKKKGIALTYKDLMRKCKERSEKKNRKKSERKEQKKNEECEDGAERSS